MPVVYKDFSIEVKAKINDQAIAFLHEASSEIETQAKRNSRRKTGKTSGAFTYEVDEGDLKSTIGNTEQNALWEEFGTGDYASKGDGRKGGWFYVDDQGNGHFTHGKTPTHALQRAFDSRKNAIINYAKQIFGEM